LLLMYVGYRVGADRAYRLIPAYLGLPTEVPRELVALAQEILPPPVFLLALASVVLSVVVVVGLYFRARPFYYLFLGNAVLSTLLTIGVTFHLRGQTLLVGIGGILIAFTLVWLGLQLQDDFFTEKRRILLQAEPEAAEGQDFWLHGRRFARAGMWALAALHLQKALTWLPDNADLHLDLALACIQLRRYRDAADALAEARRLQPHSRRIQEASRQLEQLLAGNPRR
ncbi:MAG: tetratricopeptide repeat protein, partial [Chloroflexia bacterium]